MSERSSVIDFEISKQGSVESDQLDFYLEEGVKLPTEAEGDLSVGKAHPAISNSQSSTTANANITTASSSPDSSTPIIESTSEPAITRAELSPRTPQSISNTFATIDISPAETRSLPVNPLTSITDGSISTGIISTFESSAEIEKRIGTTEAGTAFILDKDVYRVSDEIDFTLTKERRIPITTDASIVKASTTSEKANIDSESVSHAFSTELNSVIFESEAFTETFSDGSIVKGDHDILTGDGFSESISIGTNPLAESDPLLPLIEKEASDISTRKADPNFILTQDIESISDEVNFTLTQERRIPITADVDITTAEITTVVPEVEFEESTGTKKHDPNFVLTQDIESISDEVNFVLEEERRIPITANVDTTTANITKFDIEADAQTTVSPEATPAIASPFLAERDLVFVNGIGSISTINASMLDIHASLVTSSDLTKPSITANPFSTSGIISVRPPNVSKPVVNSKSNNVRTSIKLSPNLRGPLVKSQSTLAQIFENGWIIEDSLKMRRIRENNMIFSWDSINIEFTANKSDRNEDYSRLRNTGGRISKVVKNDGSISTVDTLGNNTYTLYPPKKLENIIGVQDYCVKEYSESSLGHDSQTYDINLELSPIESSRETPNIKQDRSNEKEWEFKFSKSKIYSQNVDVSTQSRTFNDGLEQYDLSIILSREEIKIFKDTMTNLEALNIIDYDDTEKSVVDYSPEKTNMINITPPNNNVFDETVYGVLDWEMDLVNYDMFRISMDLVKMDTSNHTVGNIDGLIPNMGNILINSQSKNIKSNPLEATVIKS